MDERLLDEVERSVVINEGYRAKPYQDTLGVWTIGHGITSLTKEESLAVVRLKLEAILHQLRHRLPFFQRLPHTVKGVLIEMSYQMGVDGVFGFKKTLEAIRGGDYEEAAAQMLDSKWHTQTPGRAKSLSKIIGGAS
ncbi:MAG: glycoside hydrolase family protein [Phycisphaerales bacterium]|nr:glycoside hydrolase family protein [Phycisphaerales bacterium]